MWNLKRNDTNELIYSQLIFDKGTKIIFSANGAGTTEHPHAKE